MSLGLGIGTPFQPVLSSSGFLLDEVSGAVAGWSFRKLRAAYSGNAVRIRADRTGQPESDFGFTAAGVFDTAAAESWLAGDDGYLVTWYDQVSSNDQTQSTAADQPLIASAGSFETGSHGLPVANSSANNRAMDLPDLTNSGAVTNQTIFGIVEVAVVSTNHNLLGGGTGDGSFNSQYGWNAWKVKFSTAFRWGTRDAIFTDVPVANTAVIMGTHSVDGGSPVYVEARINGSDSALLSAATSDSFGCHIIGNTATGGENPMQAGGEAQPKWAELVVWNSDKFDGSEATIEANMNAYASIY